jgi:hypothetical protein
MIKDGDPGWEEYVPPEVAAIIKERCLFGLVCEPKGDRANT